MLIRMSARVAALTVLLGLPATAMAQARADAVLQKAADAGFSGYVLAVSDGRALIDVGIGAADAEAGTAIDSSTIFSIGSVTKQFTRAAILRLEQEGRLSLTDPISRFIDGLPADKRGITIGQVLDMRAGFGEYHDTAGDHQPMTKAEALRTIGAQKLRFEPGTSQGYSNSGYTLLAAIIEAAGGMSYEDYLRRTFFQPLGMTSTGFYGDAELGESRFAKGRGRRTFGDNVPARWPRPSWALIGGGGMVSTPHDLARWIGAMRGGKVLDSAALAKMYVQPEWTAYAGNNDFGFTTMVMELRGGRDILIASANAGSLLSSMIQLADAVFPDSVPDAMRQRMQQQAQQAPPQGGGNVQAGGAAPNDPVAVALRGFMTALRSGDADTIRKMVTEQFEPAFRDRFPMSQHVEILMEVGAMVRRADSVAVTPTGPGTREIRIVAGGETIVVQLTIEEAAPHRITRISVDG